MKIKVLIDDVEAILVEDQAIVAPNASVDVSVRCHERSGAIKTLPYNFASLG